MFDSPNRFPSFSQLFLENIFNCSARARFVTAKHFRRSCGAVKKVIGIEALAHRKTGAAPSSFIMIKRLRHIEAEEKQLKFSRCSEARAKGKSVRQEFEAFPVHLDLLLNHLPRNVYFYFYCFSCLSTALEYIRKQFINRLKKQKYIMKRRQMLFEVSSIAREVTGK